MTPELKAAQEPHLWTPGAPARGKILVSHPEVELNITRGEYFWFLRIYRRPANAYGNGHSLLAEIPRTHKDKGFEGARADAVKFLGQDVRQAHKEILQEIRAWILWTRGPLDNARVSRHMGKVYTMDGQHNFPIPDPLMVRLREAQHVMFPHATQNRLVREVTLSLDMPISGHLMLDLMARIPRAHFNLD